MFKGLIVSLFLLPLFALADPDFTVLQQQAPDMAQLIAVKASAVPATTAQVWVLENGVWAKQGAEFAAVVGRNGTTRNKREGDGKTPEGLFPFVEMYGVTERTGLKMDYTKLTAQDKWIDDVNHADYNKYVRGATTAKSFEKLLRTDHQYDLFAVVGYNMTPIVPGLGSAIFMHIWRHEGNGTDGCVAMAPENMERMAQLLDPAKQPHILIAP